MWSAKYSKPTQCFVMICNESLTGANPNHPFGNKAVRQGYVKAAADQSGTSNRKRYLVQESQSPSVDSIATRGRFPM